MGRTSSTTMPSIVGIVVYVAYASFFMGFYLGEIYTKNYF